jgi:hypothetical protein
MVIFMANQQKTAIELYAALVRPFILVGANAFTV